MLIGEYTHTLDTKNRVSLPSKFRKELGKTVIITHGLDACLFLYSMNAWEEFANKLGDLSVGTSDTRRFARFILGNAHEVDLDKSGRILVPDTLKNFASLTDKVVFAGLGSRVELWNESAWQQGMQEITKQADSLAEKLGDLGMI